MKVLFLASALLLAGCGTTVRYMPCPDARLPAEPFPDTKEAVAQVPRGHIKELDALLLKGRAARDQRLSEDDEQIKDCAAPRAAATVNVK